MEVSYLLKSDGQVFVTIPDLEIMTEALNDSIGSLPPRGDTSTKPSTYWIDKTLSRLDNGDQRLSAGNCTILSLTTADNVQAEYDYDDGTGPIQEISKEDFRKLLNLWRALVVESANQSSVQLPETYRRNPY